MVEILKNFPLFQGIAMHDLRKLLRCLSAQEKSFEKGQWIINGEEPNQWVGLVLQGYVQLIHHDYYGNRTIFSELGVGQLAEAKTDSTVLLFDYHRIIGTCSSSCVFHRTLIFNMLGIINEKNQQLSEKLLILSKRSSREKLLAFLSSEAQKAGSNQFHIPFSRQELADYLSLDRSALSNELSKMQKDGLILCNRNDFTLLTESRSP
jgi:CRP-like cAMP-binding protein